jgi:hypothetical protein
MQEILVAHPDHDVCERLSIALAAGGVGVTATQLAEPAQRLAVYVDAVLISAAAAVAGRDGLAGYIAQLRASNIVFDGGKRSCEVPVIQLLEPTRPTRLVTDTAVSTCARPASLQSLVGSQLQGPSR